MSSTSSEHNGNGSSFAQHLNWAIIPIEHPAEGIERQMFVGKRMMICRFRFKPFLVTPEHDHPHEQMTIVERGHVRFFIEGKEQIASAGDVLQDRKSTRLNSSHVEISYAVFCLKKKTKYTKT